MQYRVLPRTGDRLSALGFGCMRLPQQGRAIDEAKATALLHRAIEAGVNYVDTAMPYHHGESEPWLGRALRGGWRERVQVATKLPPWSVDNRRDADRLLAAQLERLATDRIDFYLLHTLTTQVWVRLRELGIIEFLQQALADGRIRRAGFSYHGDREGFAPIIDAFPWDFCLLQFNYLDEHRQAGIEGVRYAVSRQVGVIVMEPLRGGLLAHPAPPSVQAVFDRSGRRQSPATWALRWVLDHPEVTTVLSGMNEEAQLDENLAIVEQATPGCCDAIERQTVLEARTELNRLMPIPCTACRYCLPCPAGVDIPGCFEIFNHHRLFGARASGPFMYLLRNGGMLNAPGLASQCTSCGRCVSKCPQSIAIPDQLRTVAAEFEGPMLWVKRWGARIYFKLSKWLTLWRTRGAGRRRASPRRPGDRAGSATVASAPPRSPPSSRDPESSGPSSWPGSGTVPLILGLLLLAAGAAVADYPAAMHAFEQRDYARAIAEFRRIATNLDCSKSQYMLGKIYEQGLGERVNLALAQSWYRKAAVNGRREAQTALAAMLDAGRGCPKNPAEAAIWYARAAEGGDVVAQAAYGMMLAEGRGVQTDLAAAQRWLSAAAGKGDAGAKRALGKLYFAEGTRLLAPGGTPSDPVEVYICFKLAAAVTPDPDLRAMAVRYRDQAAAQMTREQIDDANVRSINWRPR